MMTNRTNADELLEIRKKIGRTIRDTRPDRFKAIDRAVVRDNAQEAAEALNGLIRKLGGKRRGRKSSKPSIVAKRAD